MDLDDFDDDDNENNCDIKDSPKIGKETDFKYNNYNRNDIYYEDNINNDVIYYEDDIKNNMNNTDFDDYKINNYKNNADFN